MSNWQDLLNNDESRNHVSRKPNKNILCRKNKQGSNYGPHMYDPITNRCVLCCRLKNKNTSLNIKEESGEENE